ncbi:MAG TPA: hypothetical protein DIT18_08530 [Pseudomonas sp.]|nr:hypothetical protein [Pseudomonas sp.]
MVLERMLIHQGWHWIWGGVQNSICTSLASNLDGLISLMFWMRQSLIRYVLLVSSALIMNCG